MLAKDHPTAVEAYDELLSLGVTDPFVHMMGVRWFVGRWEVVHEVAIPRLTTGPRPFSVTREWILPVGRLAMVVLGEADTLSEAMGKARERLHSFKERGSGK